MNQMGVIWITGLSGSGKTTLATEVVRLLRDQGKTVLMLDGDRLRNILQSSEATEKNHGREARIRHAFQYSALCRLISNQRIIVVIATISLFHEVHEWNKEHLRGYFEVYLRVPLDELERRDSKKIYSQFASGELTNVPGLDLEIDEPVNPDKVIEFDYKHSINRTAMELIDELSRKTNST